MTDSSHTTFGEAKQHILDSLKNLPRRPAKRTPAPPHLQPRPKSRGHHG